MTRREMAADELERVLGYLANGRNNSADLPFEAARVRAHIAALRARADVAVNAMADVTEVLVGERPVGVMRETTLEAAHSLKARADAAEADNSVLVDVLRSVEHVDSRNPSAGMRYCPACGECEAGHTEACMLGHALHGAFRPGTGYRAKVRAELLRELAAYHRERVALEWHLEKKWHMAEATRLEAHADREEQA